MSIDALRKAIRIAGGQRELALLLGRDPSTVSCWLGRDRGRVPSGHVLAVCEFCDWQVTPHELRPDLYPHRDDGLPDAMRKGAA